MPGPSFGDAGEVPTPRATTPAPGRHVAVRASRWLFVNRRTGRLTVAQWPNLALWAFIAGSVAMRVVHPAGHAGTALRVLTIAALILWALDEVCRGVNPFRRFLGLVVLLATIANIVIG
jgi:hypothetical protein